MPAFGPKTCRALGLRLMRGRAEGSTCRIVVYIKYILLNVERGLQWQLGGGRRRPLDGGLRGIDHVMEISKRVPSTGGIR